MLEPGRPFPSISGTTTKNNQLDIPGDLEGKWAVLLFYRGGW